MSELKMESWQEEGQWQEQIKNQVNTLEKLNQYIDITPDEEKAIKTLNIRWGTTPYYASLMDKSNPDCPIRKMVIPSMKENENKYGIPNYLVFKQIDLEKVKKDLIVLQDSMMTGLHLR
jgi:lysine 2,3-aminomutase